MLSYDPEHQKLCLCKTAWTSIYYTKPEHHKMRTFWLVDVNIYENSFHVAVNNVRKNKIPVKMEVIMCSRQDYFMRLISIVLHD